MLEAARRANIPIAADCGGVGLCGRCKLRIVEGKVKSGETFVLSPAEKEQGWILACTSFPEGDVIVEAPPESLQEGVITEPDYVTLSRGGDLPYRPGPLVEKVFVKCPPPDEDDTMCDLDRLYLALKEKTGYGDFTMPYRILKDLSELLRQAEWKITVTFSALHNPPRILAVDEGDQSGLNYGIALDLGTTNIDAVIIDLASNNVVKRISYPNPQAKYGEDITARLNFVSRKNGLLILNDIIIDRINEILMELTFESRINKNLVNSISISANTIMLHMLLGLNTELIRKKPHVPAAMVYPVLNARELNLYSNPEALVFLSPCVGNYVGGDIVSALLSTGMKDSISLLVDIGTNGEVAAFIDGAIFCASTSAGPALEGGGIKWGTRASPGAINRFYYSETHGDFSLMTIGDSPPRGICGPGLIDFLASLLLQGFIDKRGRFRNRSKTSRIRTNHGEDEFILVYSDKEEEVISVTEKEINYLIHSKGSIYTGIEFLLEKCGIDISQVDRFYISGAMGGRINIENAVTIGLFPDIDREKFVFVGNGSLEGGKLLLQSREAWEKALDIARSAVYFEFSGESGYMESYTSSLFLPHTNLEDFPSVIKKLEHVI